jgi:hypothetical protein
MNFVAGFFCPSKKISGLYPDQAKTVSLPSKSLSIDVGQSNAVAQAVDTVVRNGLHEYMLT